MNDDLYEYRTYPIEAWMEGAGVHEQLERYKHMYDSEGFEWCGEVALEVAGEAPDVRQKLYQYRRLK